MTPEPQPSGGQQVSRVFEQPPDAVSCYSDFAQIAGTTHEVIMQFYETIPSAPGPGGQVSLMRSRLRATIILSKAHAANIGSLLLKQVQDTGGQPS
jgi:hypothetical protein